MSDTAVDENEHGEEVETEEVEPNPGERGKVVSALITLAGVWLLVAPVLFEVVPLNFWNDVIVGVALIVLGGYNFYRRGREQLASTAAASLVALLGAWLIVAPYIFDVGFAVTPTNLGFWNDIIVGLVVLALGAYSAYESRDVDFLMVVEE